MSRFKHSINSVHTRPWIERVGRLILNFSAIEMESIYWFVQLSEREFEIKALVEIPFASRVTQVMRHIDERSTGSEWRKRSLRAWNEVHKLAHLRNQVAHNPIVFGWNKIPEVGLPNVLGIPNLRARSTSKAKWLMSTNDADQAINSMAAVAKTLAELRIEWCAARDEGQAPPVRVRPALWNRMRRRIRMVMLSWKKARSH
jgi:hypothetical protein